MIARAAGSAVTRRDQVRILLDSFFHPPKETVMLQTSPMYAYLPAKDVKRARQFYEQKLGLKPKQEMEDAVVYEFAERTACFLYPTQNAGTNKASQAFWHVEDVEREVAELKKRGVKFEEYDTPDMKTENGIMSTPGGKAAWFKDTEGNILALVEGEGP
jgi:predicted enzyme related to lactoylglutathione lyase